MRQRLSVRAKNRPGLAAVELALLLPLLAYMLMAAVDFARIFYSEMVLDGCARNGALYGQLTANDPTSAFASLQAAALADANANGLTPAPTVAVGYGSSAAGPFSQTNYAGSSFVQVSVTWTFDTLASYPGIPNQSQITRVCTMAIPPTFPILN